MISDCFPDPPVNPPGRELTGDMCSWCNRKDCYNAVYERDHDYCEDCRERLLRDILAGFDYANDSEKKDLGDVPGYLWVQEHGCAGQWYLEKTK